ncbi:MAG: 23S rRNA (pseudouridine(1915)-N(3))-methyltransferase RlmH [Clostridiales bacterium]|nr:23S rRNA (pseudouridine(1915)-N(3))-methyltransferase RlmH [Clostridiales bacterium]
MRITVIAVGKIKEKFLREAIAEYSRRLGAYCKLEIREVADEKTPDGIGPAAREQILRREGERILKLLREDAYVVALAIEGEMISSEQLAARLDRMAVEGVSHIAFIIGGSLGLSREVLERADWRLSFSRMTFPHPLMRVILLEQIYRGCRINAGAPYHK